MSELVVPQKIFLNRLPVSDQILLIAGILLIGVVIVLLLVVFRLQRNLRGMRPSDRFLREDFGRLSQELARQLDSLQNNLAGRVAETARDQREINALFLGQLQQYGQGSGQQLETVRQQVSESLGKVTGSLQEMQVVTAEVRSLKQILGNVRTRGIIGELQLERLLEEVLAPGQFERNVRIRKEKQEAVEFAVRIPGSDDGDSILLPIDAKFPLDYLSRLLAAQDAGDTEACDVFRRELKNRIRQEARKIAGLYISPPETTDFAILYLPTESLFAEVVREADMIADLYRDYRIVVAGPSSMTAMLAGLQATFRLQAMEQKSLLIAQILGEVQRDFGYYEESLERVRNRLLRVLNEMEDHARKAGKVRRRLDALDLFDTDDLPDEQRGELEDNENE
ncbi:MAG: DNA recombination protein RmuC [Saccharofermentanales bacterium]|jgi:DNA recombination protein RmuC